MQSLLDSIDVPTPPPLNPGPLVGRLFFESPWLVVAVLAVAALVSYVTLNRRGQFAKGVKSAGLLLLVAVGLGVLASLVETPRERMKASSRALVEAVATANTTSLSTLLASDARLVYFASPQGLDKTEILALVDQRFRGEYRIGDWSIIESQATIDGPTVGRVQLKVRVVAAEWNVPNLSWWRIDFRLSGDKTVEVIGISPIVIAGVRDAR